jgi:hypothetical protein
VNLSTDAGTEVSSKQASYSSSCRRNCRIRLRNTPSAASSVRSVPHHPVPTDVAGDDLRTSFMRLIAVIGQTTLAAIFKGSAMLDIVYWCCTAGAMKAALRTGGLSWAHYSWRPAKTLGHYSVQ